MVRLLQFILTLVTTSVRSRLSLQTENAALRNQLFLYRKSTALVGFHTSEHTFYPAIRHLKARGLRIPYRGL